MSEFEPELLDDADRLLAADRGGLLRSLAAAGAQVRRAIGTIDEFGVERLREGDPPRAVLVAPDPHSAYLSSLLSMLGRHSAPVIDWRDPSLPRWAGPADALLVISADGRHPRLAELVDQADRRGLALAVVAPAGSPVAVAAARHPTADVSYLATMPTRAIWWALATPALQAMDSLGLTDNAMTLNRLADALDEVAEANRPDSSAFTGPAKVLASDLAGSVPVIAGAGPGATVAARRIAGSVQLIGGSTAMAASLPDDVARVGALLEFAGDSDEAADFFADRENPGVAPRLVLVGAGVELDYGERLSDYPEDPTDRLGELAARRAASALAELAASRGIGSSRIDVPDAPTLIRFGVAAATGDFAASYLALGRGIDPSAPRLGELPH
ncbi:MAG: bifunctional glucose-6-phosphate/mannose-6-phosphate isomerase [Frankiales bacterium]|nr:bifunctional glucose-6-phosphate/mannose-6-phosphate isomerase [Frankiales bacterium]